MSRRSLTRLVALLLVLVAFSFNLPLRGEIAAIKVYRVVLSPVVANGLCRYQPTCSQYGLQVLENRGFWHGNLLLVHRLILCSPLGLVLDPDARAGSAAEPNGGRLKVTG